MVSRISESIIINTATRNIQNALRNLQETQDILSTGLRIRRPSDDPLGASTVLRLRGQIAQMDRFITNMDRAESFVNSTEGALGVIDEILLELREITVTEANDTGNAESRAAAAEQVEALIQQLVQTANTDFGGRYIFAGHETKTSPFVNLGSRVEYRGDGGAILEEIGENNVITINIPGNEAFSVYSGQIVGSANLNPDISEGPGYDTPLALLNGGTGVDPGSIVITDGDGDTSTIDLSGAVTIGDVIATINADPTVDVTVEINEDGSGLFITDNTVDPTLPLTIAEDGTTTTAADLGILGSTMGGLLGTDLDPTVEASTPVSLLNGGNGVELGVIRITNGELTGTVDLNGAVTVDDILTAIDGSGLEVDATIDVTGTRLVITSLLGDTPMIIVSEGTEDTAEDLGLFAPGVFETAFEVKQALLDNDSERLTQLIQNVDDSLSQVIAARTGTGQQVTQMSFARERLLDMQLSLESIRSKTEEADLTVFATQLIVNETIYQVALEPTAGVIQPSIFSFLG